MKETNKKYALQAIAVFLVITVAVFVTMDQTLPPRALPASAPATQFSAERAIEHIKVIAQEPRLVGQPGFEVARDYVIGKLTELGLTTEVQKTAGVENVLGKLAGTASQDAILLVAHLDSTAYGPGASDDASGVAVLLETARALQAGAPLRNSVILLFTAPEETGYQGAQAFISEHPWLKDVKLVINFDTGGLSGPSELTNLSYPSGWLVRHLARADPYVFASSDYGEGDSDFIPFKIAGYSGYAFDYARDRRKHGPSDNIENLNPPSIQHQGYHALYLARYFGNLDSLVDSKEPDPIFFTFLRLGLIYYPKGWVMPITLVCTLVLVGVVALGFRRKCLTLPGVGLGALVFAVSVVTAPLVVRLLWAVLSSTVPAYQVRYYGHAANEPLLLGLFASLAIAVTSTWYALLQVVRKVRLPDLTMGALALLFMVMIYYSFTAPESSFRLTWSLLFASLAAGYLFHSTKTEGEALTAIQILGFLVAAIAAITLLLPGIYMGFTGSEIDDLFMPMVVLVVLVGLLVPPLHIITRPGRWWLPVVAALLTVVLLMVAVLG